MKNLLFLIFVVFFSCTGNNKKREISEIRDTTISSTGNIILPHKNIQSDSSYSNDRFRKVTVQKLVDSFLVKGEAKVFEAAFSWVVADGKIEYASGHEMTQAGAPAWGQFEFNVPAEKKGTKDVMHVILFESSPKDGSRQSELSIPLPQ